MSNASTSPMPFGIYPTPFTITGAAVETLEKRTSGSSAKYALSTSGRRHATWSVPTLSASIWSSAEYFVLPRSPPKLRHSPLAAPCWAKAADAASTRTATIIQSIGRERMCGSSFWPSVLVLPCTGRIQLLSRRVSGRRSTFTPDCLNPDLDGGGSIISTPSGLSGEILFCTQEQGHDASAPLSARQISSKELAASSGHHPEGFVISRSAVRVRSQVSNHINNLATAASDRRPSR